MNIEENLKSISELYKQEFEIKKNINRLSKSIEEDLYFSVIDLTNNMDVEHIVNGVSFEILNKKTGKKSIFKFTFNISYILNYDISYESAETKEEIFKKFFNILKNDFPQEYRKLKIKRLMR